MTRAGSQTIRHPSSRVASPPRVARGRLRVQVAHDLEVARHLCRQWDQLSSSTGGGIFSTWDWCRTWWDHYGAGRQARVFLFHDDDEFVGALPMFVDILRIGPLSLKAAKLMGSESTQGLCAITVRPEWARTALENVFEHLVVRDRCDAIHIGPLSDEFKQAKLVRQACRRRGDLVLPHRHRAITQTAVIALPDSYDAYLASLSRNQRFNIRKEWRRLNADFNVDVDIVTDPAEVRNELNELIRMHRRQWRRRGNLGHFDDWPGSIDFSRALISTLSRTGRTLFLRISADGRIVARQYGLIFGDTCHCRFAARLPDPEWEKYGLGRLSLVRMFEHLIESGIRRVDVGVGHYDYKLRLGGTEHPVRSILLVANRDGARSRARLFCAAADILDRVYYKTWHYRIAPHLPLPRRPLWKSWIRSRL